MSGSSEADFAVSMLVRLPYNNWNYLHMVKNRLKIKAQKIMGGVAMPTTD